MLVVPQTLADGLIRACGDAGRRWIECLPERVERLCAEWGLQLVEEQPPYGDWNLVLFARRGREPCVLKIFGPDPRATDEARALTTWAGRGAVLPLEVSADQGGVVLERLDPTRSLTGVSLKLAAETAGSLIRQLTVPPRRDCHCWSSRTGPCRDARSTQKAQGDPLPPRWIALAVQVAYDLASATATAWCTATCTTATSWLAPGNRALP